MTVRDVLSEALKLPEPERLELADRIYESLDEPADPDADRLWAAEIKRRLELIDSGQASFMSWDEARRYIAGKEDGGAAD